LALRRATLWLSGIFHLRAAHGIKSPFCCQPPWLVVPKIEFRLPPTGGFLYFTATHLQVP
jgi:hypothetical protein